MNQQDGGTYTLAICDEFAYAETTTIQTRVLSGIRSSAKQKRLIISTPQVENDIYHELVKQAEHEGRLFRRDIHDVKDDWYGSPENAQEWLDKELFKGKSKAEINREYLCEFKGAATNTVWEILPEHLSADPGVQYPTVVALDLGYKPDPTVVLFARVVNNRLFISDELVCLENTVYHVADKIKGKSKDKNYKLFWGTCDSSGKKVDQTSRVERSFRIATFTRHQISYAQTT